MATQNTQQSRYRMISIMTFVVLLLGFAYYYFIYVQSNEEAFNRKAFRIIERAGTNVEAKYFNYQKVAKTALQNRKEMYDDGHLQATVFDTIVSLKDIVDGYSVPDNLFAIITQKFRATPTTVYVDSVKLKIADSKVLRLTVFTEINELIKNTQSSDFFGKHIIFSDTLVYWSDFQTTRNLNISLDSLFKREKGDLINLFHSSDRLEIEFDNNPQLLYFTPVSLSGNTIYLGGVIDKAYFTRQAFKLGTNSLIVILVLLLLLILALPFLKLLLLSANERLGTWDALFSFLVMVLGSGFVLLSILAYYSQSGPSRKTKNELLKNYSQKIENNFTRELGDILKQLDTNDAYFSANPNSLTLISTFAQKLLKEIDNLYIKSDSVYYKTQALLKVTISDKKLIEGCFDSIRKNLKTKSFENIYDKTVCTTTDKPNMYKYAKGTFWMNSNGDQLVKWQPKNITPRVNVRFRKYFSVPNNDKSILWSDPKINKGEGFFIEAIHAVTTGKSFAMISKRSLAGSFPFVKFKNKKATVVSMGSRMQSMANLSLPSNISYLIIDEKGQVLFHKDSTKILQENLFEETNNNTQLMEAVYGRVETTFRCNYNELHSRFYISPIGNLPLFLLVVLDEDNEKMTEARALSLSVLFYFLLLLLVFVQIGLFVAVDYKRKKKVKGYGLFFEWIWPKPDRKAVFQLLSLYLLVAIIVFFTGAFYKNVLLVFSFFSFLLTVSLFVLRGFNNPFSKQAVLKYRKYYIYFASMLLIGFLLYPFCDHLGVRQILLFVFFIGFSVLIIIASVQTKIIYAKLPLSASYNIWVLLFIVVLGMLPVHGFYARAVNFERSVYQRHMQLSLAKSVMQHAQLSGDTAYRNYRTLNDHFVLQKSLTDNELSADREYRLIKEIRLPLGKGNRRTAVLSDFTPGSDSVFKWKETNNSIQLTYKPGKTQNPDSVLVSAVQKYSISPGDFLVLSKAKFYGFRFEMFVAFILLLALLYFIVNYWTTKLFLLDIIPMLKSNITRLIENSSFTYIVSPPHAGVRPFVENQLKAKVYFEDLRYIESSKGKATGPKPADEVALVFDAGSIDINSLKHSVERIDALKQLVLDDGKLKRLIVISQFTPKKVLNTVKEWEQLFQGKEKEKDLLELKKLSNQYLDILGGFNLTYFMLTKNDGEAVSEEESFLAKELKGVKILDEKIVEKMFNNPDFDMEDKVLNIQNSAQLYYHAIWNSLEKREHLLIYDLAQDGLVNYRNLYIVYNLISRGILTHKNGRLRLFNKSFANFVLTIIDKEQALEFERDAKRNGSWANLKLPFMIIIAGVLMFMFLSQQEVFNQLIGWFTAAIALLPVLTRLMTTFSGFSKK